jgi:flagellar assembly protein FliH
MDPVIRAPHFGLAKASLPVVLPGVASVARPAAAEPAEEAAPALPRTVAEHDPAALRRQVEQALRKQWAAEQEASLAQARAAAVKEGRAEGHAQGLKEGREAAEQASRAAEEARAQRVGELFTAIHGAHAKALADRQGEVAALALEAVVRVAGLMGRSRAWVQGLVDTACRGLRPSGELALRLHPRDAELLAPGAATVRAEGLPPLTLIPDERLSLGGCVVECGAGEVDASLQTQLARLHDALCGDGAEGAAREAP